MTVKKGIRSRQWIVEQSVHVFNTFGLDITWSQLAGYLDISRGRISHFFTTRDALFLAISQAHQHRIQRTYEAFKIHYPDYNFEQLKLFFGNIMDNQYDFRCAIMYAAGTGNSVNEMNRQIREFYRFSLLDIRTLIEVLVKTECLTPEILEEKNYDLFEVQFVNILSTWVISKEIFFPERAYLDMKPLYLSGLMQLFQAYLNVKN